MPEAEKRTILILGGGGARGLAHIGVLRVLEEKCVRFDGIVGTSIGALVGGLYAAGIGVEAMEKTVLGIDLLGVAKILRPKLFQPGVIDSDNVKKYLRSFVGDVRIEKLPLFFAAVATDLATGEEVVFDKGPLVDAVMASIAIPDLFQPVRAQGRYLVDGGLCNPLPVSIAKARGAERTIAVNVAPDPKAMSPKKRFRRSSPTLANVFMQSLNIGTNNLIALHLRLATPDVLIAPLLDEFELLEFHKGVEIMKRGRDAAAAALPQLEVS